MQDSWYDTAQICTNGHIINILAKSNPINNEKFCHECGAPTITNCQDCGATIRGYYHTHGIPFGYNRPAFCYKCGKPYLWTEAGIQAARDLSDTLENLTDEEREELKENLDDIVRDTPQARVAAMQFKRMVAKAGKVAAAEFKDILVDIVSEAIKKVIWPA